MASDFYAPKLNSRLELHLRAKMSGHGEVSIPNKWSLTYEPSVARVASLLQMTDRLYDCYFPHKPFLYPFYTFKNYTSIINKIMHVLGRLR